MPPCRRHVCLLCLSSLQQAAQVVDPLPRPRPHPCFRPGTAACRCVQRRPPRPGTAPSAARRSSRLQSSSGLSAWLKSGSARSSSSSGAGSGTSSGRKSNGSSWARRQSGDKSRSAWAQKLHRPSHRAGRRKKERALGWSRRRKREQPSASKCWLTRLGQTVPQQHRQQRQQTQQRQHWKRQQRNWRMHLQEPKPLQQPQPLQQAASQAECPS